MKFAFRTLEAGLGLVFLAEYAGRAVEAGPAHSAIARERLNRVQEYPLALQRRGGDGDRGRHRAADRARAEREDRKSVV